MFDSLILACSGIALTSRSTISVDPASTTKGIPMAGRIIVLSLSERVAPYQEALASFELEVEYLENVMEVFRSCVRRPPGALIVDMVSASALDEFASIVDANISMRATLFTRRFKDLGLPPMECFMTSVMISGDKLAPPPKPTSDKRSLT